MLYILVLLLVPVFFVGIVVFISTLIDYVLHDNLDMMFLLIGFFATLISSFFILKELSLVETKNYRFIRFQKKVDCFITVLSFTLVLLFGVSLIMNCIKFKMDYPRLFIGISSIILYFYVIYIIFIQRKMYVCIVKDITKISDKSYMILLHNKDLGIVEYYVKDKKELKKDKSYKVYYNKIGKNIIKILNEVIEV